MRSSAQGLFMLMTNGVGATVGTLAAQAVINRYVNSQPAGQLQIDGWHTSWLIFAAYALAVAVFFVLIFHDKDTKASGSDKNKAKEILSEDPEGMIDAI